MLRQQSVWGGLVALGATSAISGIGILALDVAQADHRYGWALIVFGAVAVIGGGIMYLLLTRNGASRPNAIAQADRGGVANIGDGAVIVNMPHIGDILRVASEDAKEDTRVFIRERSPGEVLERIKTLRPLERKVVADKTYLGRWVRWSGIVSLIEPFALGIAGEAYTVTVLSNDVSLYLSRLEFEADKRWRVEPLSEGDHVTFEAKIDRLFATEVYLRDARFTDSDGPSSPANEE